MRKLLYFIAVSVIASAMSSFTRKTTRDDVSPEPPTFRSLVEKADAGDPEAMFRFALLLDTGYDSIQADSARATALFRSAAEKGFAPAMNYLGFRYFNGEGIRRDVDSALFWLAKAAGAGDVKAASNLGYLLSHDDAVTRDYPQAAYWLGKAADAGLPVAQSLLADLMRQGLGLSKDTAEAERLYEKAIEGGLADAELKLLSMKGRDWEHLTPDSAVTLGRIHYNGRAPFIGVTLFENAAAEGNRDAMALLGDAYSKARGVDYDHDRSLYYFLRAAILGQPSAQFVIGELLDIFPDALRDSVPAAVVSSFFGESPPGGINTAAYWYEMAKKSGILDAESASDSLLRSHNHEK